jgi:hypothetical protein
MLELLIGIIVFLIEITLSLVSQLIDIKERNKEVVISKNIINFDRGFFIQQIYN